MKKLLFLLFIIGIIVLIYYCYQHQLGAIPFYILSVFFFFLVIKFMMQK